MAKAKVDNKSLIHFELEKLESKVKEFQQYLEKNSVNNRDPFAQDTGSDYQDKLHKELLVQIKIQDALFNWVPLLQKLREIESEKKLETRGDVEVSGLFKRKTNG